MRFCCDPFLLKHMQKTFGKVCRPRFIALLLRVPCTPVLQTTASVMPERSKPPNLALKRNAKSPFCSLLHIFPLDFQHFWPLAFDNLMCRNKQVKNGHLCPPKRPKFVWKYVQSAFYGPSRSSAAHSCHPNHSQRNARAFKTPKSRLKT